MTEPASLTPVGERLRELFGGEDARGTTHSAGCASWHVLCAYQAGGREALRQLAADLTDEAADIAELGEVPWAAMLGLKVTDPKLAAAILRRAAEVALNRAEAPASVPASAGNPSASGGRDHDHSTERTRP
jgi:hypothetical protein